MLWRVDHKNILLLLLSLFRREVTREVPVMVIPSSRASVVLKLFPWRGGVG